MPGKKGMVAAISVNQREIVGMNVLFIGASSVGPRWIMSLLKKKGHAAYGIFMGYENIELGEPAVPFSAAVSSDFIKDKKIELVGLTVDSLNVNKALEISCAMRKDFPAIKLIWGGIHPTIMPEECIQFPEVDYICVGEGELAMLELCDAYEAEKRGSLLNDSNIKNIWAKNRVGVHKNGPRPYVDIEELDFDRTDIYYNGIYTGRGCAGNCTFCSSPFVKTALGTKGPYFRKRSVEAVIREIGTMIRSNNTYLLKLLLRQRSIKGLLRTLREFYRYNRAPIRIKDDSFLLQKDWFYRFTAEFTKKFRRRGYICSARVTDVTKEVADALKSGNCKMIILGFESGDESYRNKMLNKQVVDKDIYDAAQLLKERNIPILGQWMIGMPGETPAQAIKSLRMSNRIGDVPQVHIATPLPKTKMREYAVQAGLLSPDERIAVSGVYSKFTLVPKEQESIFRFIFNAFKISGSTIAGTDEVFDRFHSDVQGRKIGKILTDDISC